MKGTLLPERWEQIIEMVDSQGNATVEQIAQGLEISPTTVRRDLARIQASGFIKRTRGGAVPIPHIRVGPTMAESRRINPLEKEWIGRKVARFIRDDDTLMIDGGYTTYQVARNITAKNLTVITNSLDVAQALANRNGVTLMVIGGELKSVSGTNIGPVAENQIQQYWADVAILGADAISPQEGLTSPASFTAETKKAMIRSSHRLIVVADHTKLGRFSPHRVASASEIDTLVTDCAAAPAIVEEFRALGLDVLIAGASDECDIADEATEELERTTLHR